MKPSTRIIQYVLEKSGAEAVETRIQLYRDLSTLVVNEAASNELLTLAKDLEAIERHHQQLVLQLQAR